MSVHAVVLIQCEIDTMTVAVVDTGITANHEDLAETIPGGIAKIAGIERTETLISFQVYSRHDLERLFSIGFDES